LRLAPMLGVLFLAAQMQAMHASRGREDPSRAVRACMELATGTLLLRALLAALAAFVTGTAPEADENATLLVGARDAPMWVKAANALTALVLSGASAGICVGTMVLRAPEELLPFGGAVSPAISCTVGLTLQFFLVHLSLAAVSGALHFPLQSRSAHKLLQVSKLAAHTVSFAPMLCALFIAARVRAMQLGGDQGEPSTWAKVAFHACSGALLLQTLLAVTMPFIPGGDARRGDRGGRGNAAVAAEFVGGDIEVRLACCEGMATASAGFAALRHGPGLLLGAGVLTVIASVLASAAGRRAPPLPPTMQCVVVLAAVYFLANLFFWAARALCCSSRGRSSVGARALLQALSSTCVAARCCPMLAVLFLSLRLRAQQVTRNTGAPQGWAQDAMYFCTGAVTLQLLICLMAGLVTGRAPAVHQGSGEIVFSREGDYPLFCKAAAGLQAAAATALCGGAAVACAGLFTLTPATAGGHGGY